MMDPSGTAPSQPFQEMKSSYAARPAISRPAGLSKEYSRKRVRHRVYILSRRNDNRLRASSEQRSGKRGVWQMMQQFSVNCAMRGEHNRDL